MSDATATYTTGQWVKAWAVHWFTATGAFFGMLALFSAINLNWRMCFIWMFISIIVDAIDGTFARWANVKKVVPGFDGAMLDNLIDFFTYSLLPAAMLYLHPTLLPNQTTKLIAVAIISITSGYWFCRTNAKTDDHTFLGFPCYWNIVVVYFILLNASPWTAFISIVVLGILIFIPIKYAYPTRMIRFQTLTLVLSYVWGALLVLPVWQFPNHATWPVYLSLVFIVYYMWVSLYMMMPKS